MFEIGFLLGKRKPSDSYISITNNKRLAETLEKHGVEIYTLPAAKKVRKAKQSTTSEKSNALERNTSFDKEENKAEKKINGKKNTTCEDPLPKDGSERKMFMSIMEVSPEKLDNYTKDKEQLALDIAKVMEKVETENTNLEVALKEEFGEKNGKIIIEAIRPNYVFLKNSLTCICRAE